ncbi:MAG TPA: PfkB family carbohydrate kinase, partial [Ruminococcus flavefaciens]|nr:PfkB family carbohydrate kinase [Ruminococcus flavefaciens]
SGNFHRCGVCKGTVVNSVGAGDSMLAGFIAGKEKGDDDYALRLGTAAGGATTFSEGLATGEEIMRLIEEL